MSAVSNGTRSLFAATREVPYYNLGARPNKRITDHREMMKFAGIDKVEYRLIPAPLPEGVSSFVVPTNHVVWDNPLTGESEVVGTVGDRYHLIQPDTTFGLFEGLNRPWDTMGIIRNGREMFGTIEWEREISLDPNGADEKVKTWLAVRTSNDGTGSLVGGRSSMRFICFNMFRTMFRDLSDKFTVRHTLSHEERIAQIKVELAKTDTYFGLQEQVVTQMFQTTLTDDAFWNIVKNEVFPKPEENKKGAETKWENRMGLISEAWTGVPNAGIRNTVYGGWQALLEANQWGRNIQKNRENGLENFNLAGAGFDAATEKFRQSMFERFYSLVEAPAVKV